MDNNHIFGRGIEIDNDGFIFLNYYYDNKWAAGDAISINPNGRLTVGEYYHANANDAELRFKRTVFEIDSSTDVYGYDVEIAQTQLGVADFSLDSSDNDTDVIVVKGHKKPVPLNVDAQQLILV